ncbi:hypothetical protein N1851_008029 [Merluccius polli]|uniref:Uncharacterized protein n=1 Tax=Merluccius polli TaxID=89951 RepID=A0AA47N3A9_MERPO|nr:hypothetical protein N1851_008029 [Merluccius polli]
MWPNNSLTCFGLVWIFLSFCHHPVAGLLHYSITNPLATRLNEPPPPHPDIACPPRRRYIHPTTDAALNSLITHIAEQVGQTIKDQLRSEREERVINETQAKSSVDQIPTEASYLNLTGAKFVLQSDIKEPPVFRGDGSDKNTVCEWQQLMEVYFKKQAIPLKEQYSDIISKLMGKAKDIVRITLRSSPSAKPQDDPKIIYDILRQHFSDVTYSCMLMADFYSTFPAAGENPVEYWLRLNKAVDAAEEGLKRLGRHIEDPCQAVAMIFVKHCPDPSLSAVFKFKAPGLAQLIELFYTPVIINNTFQVQGMLDSGSMACTLSERAEHEMLSKKLITEPIPFNQDVVLVGCGGSLSKPKCMYEVKMKLYGESCIVPVLVVPGQRDDLIVGTNVIRFIMHQLKVTSNYWNLVSSGNLLSECERLLDLLSNSSRWRGDELPDKIATVKLQQSVTLLARQEHLVWGKLPKNASMSPGSTVLVEPTSSKSIPRNIMVGRVITPLWGDRWVPMKITSVSNKPVTLKRNCKLADVSPCLAVEDFDILQNTSQPEKETEGVKQNTTRPSDLKQRLQQVGLADIDIDQCHTEYNGKLKLVELLEKYNNVFSKHALDCGEAKGFVHRIRLTDE